MELVKRHLLLSKLDLAVEAGAVAGLWAVVELIALVAQRLMGETVYVSVGGAAAMVVGMFLEWFLCTARWYSSFPLGLSMGRTRRCMAGLVWLESALHLAAVWGVIMLLAALGGPIGGLAGFAGCLNPLLALPAWLWPLVLAGVLLSSFGSGMLLLALGQKGFWVLWAVWMAFPVGMNFDLGPVLAPLAAVLLAAGVLVLAGWLAWAFWYSLRRVCVR